MVMELIADCGDDFDDDTIIVLLLLLLLLCCDDGDGLPGRHPVHLAKKRNILSYE
jgi:hypothetical protein